MLILQPNPQLQRTLHLPQRPSQPVQIPIIFQTLYNLNWTSKIPQNPNFSLKGISIHFCTLEGDDFTDTASDKNVEGKYVSAQLGTVWKTYWKTEFCLRWWKMSQIECFEKWVYVWFGRSEVSERKLRGLLWTLDIKRMLESWRIMSLSKLCQKHLIRQKKRRPRLRPRHLGSHLLSLSQNIL